MLTELSSFNNKYTFLSLQAKKAQWLTLKHNSAKLVGLNLNNTILNFNKHICEWADKVMHV